MKQKYYLWGASLLALFALILSHNIIGALNNCIHAVDFSIYQQAIYEIAAGTSLNPYLTVRDVHIFADHFDPVIFLAVPWLWLTGYHATSLIVFESLWVLATLIFLFYTLRPKTNVFLLCATFLLLTKGLLSGLIYPIHPTVWTILPVMVLVWAIKEDRTRWIIISSFAFCFFKEIFPFSIFTLGFYYLIFRKKTKLALSLILFSSFMIYFSFIIRPELFGKGENYNSIILDGLKTDFFGSIWNMFKVFHYKRSFKTFFPFILPVVFIVKNELWKKRDWKKHHLIPVVFCLVPLFAVHFIPNLLMMHRESTFVAFLLGALFYSNLPNELLKSKRLASIILLMFILSSMGRYTKMFQRVVLSKDKDKCIISEEKRMSSNKLVEKIRLDIGEDKRILATGGIVAALIQPRLQVYQSGFFFQAQKPFDYVVFERNRSGDTTPYSRYDIEKQIKICEKSGVQTIYKDNYFYYAKGPFPLECHRIIK